MKIYSDFPLQRTRQIVADLVALAVIGCGVWLGAAVGAAIATLAEAGRQLESAGAGFRSAMSDAGSALGQVPLIGTAIRVPFDAAGSTGGALEDAGQTTQSFIETTATIVGLVVAGVIVLCVCWFWIGRRIRFARRATEASRLADLVDGADILALRALMNGSARDLARVGDHPVEAWRLGNRNVIAMLAQLELREAGVRLAG